MNDADRAPLAPLHGVRVLDLSRLLPGPLATLLLSDLGAEVIRVEEPNGTDYVRHLPPLASDGQSLLFHALNRGKKSITLDLKSSPGHAKLLELLDSADVLVESFRPGVLAKLGLAPEMLLERFPRLIICSISGYGQHTSHAAKAGHDLNFVARAGILGAMHSPVPLPLLMGDMAGGSWPSALQILAALLQRAHTQRGVWIDVPMTTLASSFMLFDWVRALSDEKSSGSLADPLSGKQPCYGIYATQDGHVAVAALEQKFWQPLVNALGLSHLAEHALVDEADAPSVRSELEQVFAKKTTSEWQGLLGPLDLCVEPVVNLPSHSHLLDLHEEAGLLKKVSLQGQTLQVPGVPLFCELSPDKLKPAPQLGENNAEFLGRLT